MSPRRPSAHRDRALDLLLALHMASTREELRTARMAAITAGIPLGEDPFADGCPRVGRNGASIGCPRDPFVPEKHADHPPQTFAARIGHLTRRHHHATGHDPEASTR